MNRPQAHMVPPSRTSLPPPTPSLWVSHRTRSALPEACRKLPPATWFAHGDCMCSNAALSIGPTLSLLPWPQGRSPSSARIHQYQLSRFHIYALMYGTCFSLPVFLHSI